MSDRLLPGWLDRQLRDVEEGKRWERFAEWMRARYTRRQVRSALRLLDEADEEAELAPSAKPPPGSAASAAIAAPEAVNPRAAAAEQRNAELEGAFRPLLDALFVSHGGAKKMRGVWVKDSHDAVGLYDAARAALHDEELSAPPHEPPEIVSHGWTHVIALPAAEGAPCDCGRPPVKHLRDQRTCISAAAQGEEK